MNTPRRTIVLAMSLAVVPLVTARAQAGGDVFVTRDVKIGMRLGPPVLARVYRRADKATRPAVLALESDTSSARDQQARALAAAGFAVVIANPRAGDDKHVGRDGYDAIEWISRQPWCDRRVVMEGTGEGANAAWNTAREHPPQLSALVTRAPARPLAWSDAQFAEVATPALIIAGAYGEPQGTAVGTFMRYTRAEALGGSRAAFLAVGTIGTEDQLLIEREFFDWTLGRGLLPPFLRNRVNYMVIGDGAWHASESIESIGAVPTSYPLHSSAVPVSAPVGFLGERALDDEPTDLLRSGTKQYETIVAAPIDLAGFPSVTLWLATTATSGVDVVLEEVNPSGAAFLLGRSEGQTRFSDSTSARGLGRWEFSSFGWIAKRLPTGSRLRLTVKSAPGTVIYHDVERYSRVILPVTKDHR